MCKWICDLHGYENTCESISQEAALGIAVEISLSPISGPRLGSVALDPQAVMRHPHDGIAGLEGQTDPQVVILQSRMVGSTCTSIPLLGH